MTPISTRAALNLAEHDVNVGGPSLSMKAPTPQVGIATDKVIDRSVRNAPQQVAIPVGFIDRSQDHFEVHLSGQLLASKDDVGDPIVGLPLTGNVTRRRVGCIPDGLHTLSEPTRVFTPHPLDTGIKHALQRFVLG